MDDFMIRARYNGKVKYIFFDELSVDNFMCEVAKSFKIIANCQMNINLTDNIGADIYPEKFSRIITRYQNSGSFYVNVNIKFEINETQFVMPMDLENYLIGINAGHLLRECQIKGELTDEYRRQLIRAVVRFMQEIFGDYPEQSQKITTAKAVVALFPYLKVKDGQNGGIDLLYNTKDGGYFGSEFKYIRAKKRRFQAFEANRSLVEDDPESIQNEEDFQRDLLFLKTAVINRENLDSVKQKLKATLDHRLRMMDNKEMDLMENFPFFFSHPQLKAHKTSQLVEVLIATCKFLILYDFHQRFGNVSANAFNEQWSVINKKLREVFLARFQSLTFYTVWPEEIEIFLILLRLFPTKPSRAAPSISSFNKSLDKLIVFSKTGSTSDEMKRKDNDYPYIIAYGNSTKEILNYYIEVEKHLVSVPSHFTFMETFDLYFKLHKSLNLNFDVNLKAMMLFVQHFIYKIPEQGMKPTKRMTEIFNSVAG